MKMTINMFQRFGRFRQLHTIISQELIKPSSQTPPHLKTYSLPLIDCLNPHQHIPLVFFYKNYNRSDINNLKKSLSRCLTQYYPFAGRLLKPYVSHIDCNDEGVEFVEVSHDSRLEDFIHVKDKDEILHQLVPNANNTIPDLVKVQLNHFTGGGAAMVVSASHKVADAQTTFTFISQWAKVARGGSPIRPHFVSSSTSNNESTKLSMNEENEPYFVNSKCVTRRFLFPNFKINELKKKVISTGIPTVTRVEVITSLLFKCAVDATTARSGFFRPSSLVYAVNMRNKIFEKDPEQVGGNVTTLVDEKMTDLREITLSKLVDKIQKGKMKITERDLQDIAKKRVKLFSMLGGDPNLQPYFVSSICRFPLYELDFGWGKSVQVEIVIPRENNNIFILMDAPNREGITATVRLQEEEMTIFQKNKELHAYVDA